MSEDREKMTEQEREKFDLEGIWSHMVCKYVMYPVHDLLSPMYGPEGRYGAPHSPTDPYHWRKCSRERLRKEGFSESWIAELDDYRDRVTKTKEDRT